MSYPENGNLSVTSVLTKKDWERIYRRFCNTWRAVCKKHGVQNADAGDFINDAILKTMGKAQLGDFKYDSDIKTSRYIARAIHNLILNDKKIKRPEPLENNSEFQVLSREELDPIIKQEDENDKNVVDGSPPTASLGAETQPR